MQTQMVFQSSQLQGSILKHRPDGAQSLQAPAAAPGAAGRPCADVDWERVRWLPCPQTSIATLGPEIHLVTNPTLSKLHLVRNPAFLQTILFANRGRLQGGLQAPCSLP